MAFLFEKAVGISITATWLILAVILLRLLLRKAPKRITCFLWVIVAFRLVFPFSIESPVSLIPEATAQIQEAVDTTMIHPVTNGLQAAPIFTQQGNGTPPADANPSLSVFPMIWCVGVFLMLGYLLFSYLKMRHLVREAVREKENIWICDAIPTPFILGIFGPKIYLPSGLSESTKEYVIAHEQSHLRCKDHWWKPLAFLLLAVYWFNPLMWAAYPLVCRDIEYACDERVIRNYGLAGKKAYSEALLECSSNRKLVLACPVAFGETAVMQRIRNVLRYRKPRFWIILAALIAILITAIGFLTVPEKENALDIQEKEPQQNEVHMTTPVWDEAEAAIPQGDTDSISSEEWENYPDGIRIETYMGETFTGHVMIVRDPSSIYLAASSDPLSKDTPGIRPEQAMARENALAAVNAGRFFDDGTNSREVGSVPMGLVLAGSKVIWNDAPVFEQSFVGFNRDNILIVASSMTEAEAMEQKIRDGCTSGPILMVNGEPNREVIDENTGYNSRTAIGQRADGAVILICADGRTVESLGATNADILDILTQYGAVNACALAWGSASVMYYRDTDGRYGEAGQVQMVNNYSALQGEPGRMPTYWMVKP